MSLTSLERNPRGFPALKKNLRGAVVLVLSLFLVLSPNLVFNAQASTATGITIDVLSVSLRTGETFQLKSSFTPSGSTGGNVVWNSTSPKVASVSNGLVTALGPGVAKITVSTEDGSLNAQTTISVSIGLPLNPTFGLATWKVKGFSVPIINFDPSYKWEPVVSITNSASTPRAVLLSSGVIEVTDIDDSSEVTIDVKTSKNGYENGFASFTGSSVGIGEREIRIQIPVTSVSLNSSIATFAAGTTLAVEAMVMPINATDKKLIWSTSNSKIATVADGKIKGTGVGSAIIQVRSRDGGFTARLNITLTSGKGLTPKFGLATIEAGLLRIKIDNFDPTFSWVPTIQASTGKSKPSVSFGNDGYLSVTNINKGSRISIQLEVSKQGFEQSSGTYDFVWIDPMQQYLSVRRVNSKAILSITLGKAAANQKVTIQSRFGEEPFVKLFTSKLDNSGKITRSLDLEKGSEIRLVAFGIELPVFKIN
jgi:uncharacterized protein YjdB